MRHESFFLLLPIPRRLVARVTMGSCFPIFTLTWQNFLFRVTPSPFGLFFFPTDSALPVLLGEGV